MKRFETFSKKTRRLKGYDYRCEGLYFITICTQKREPFFGEVKNGEMLLSGQGQIAFDYWLETEQYWPQMWLGEFVVMPNHVHGIIGLEGIQESEEEEENREEAPDSRVAGIAEKNELMAALSPKAGSLSRIINRYKGACTKAIQRTTAEPFGWQPRFHDRIIRNQRELELIENYILSNPAKWQEDRFFRT